MVSSPANYTLLVKGNFNNFSARHFGRQGIFIISITCKYACAFLEIGILLITYQTTEINQNSNPARQNTVRHY